jgi:hypothetical protein
MRRVRTAGLLAFTAATTAAFVALVTPGCVQNQDNSPISISHSQGRPALSIASSRPPPPPGRNRTTGPARERDS